MRPPIFAPVVICLLCIPSIRAQTSMEALNHREYFIMYKHQDTQSLDIGCRA